MEEFIKNNLVILIICIVLIVAIIVSIILSVVVRRAQVKKNMRKEIEHMDSFKEYDVKTINVNDVDISKVEKPAPPKPPTQPPNNFMRK